MTDYKDIMAYFCYNKGNLAIYSAIRISQMIYLLDWKSSIEDGEQITDLVWENGDYGPLKNEIAEAARKDSRFRVDMVGNTPLISLGSLSAAVKSPIIPEKVRAYMDLILAVTNKMDVQEFIKMVYSTYPLQTQPKYSKLNLVELAKDYKKFRENFQKPPSEQHEQ